MSHLPGKKQKKLLPHGTKLSLVVPPMLSAVGNTRNVASSRPLVGPITRPVGTIYRKAKKVL
jgi:hypothetical protein